MTLTELKNAIDTALQHERNPENITVVIATKLPYITCGQSPCVDVKHAYTGFDWEAGQFRITPSEDLMAIKHDVPQKVVEWRGNYLCPKCEYTISRGRKAAGTMYCSKCGQAVMWDE